MRPRKRQDESAPGGRAARIVYLCPVGEIGGAEISMLDLMRRMKASGFRIGAVLLAGGPLEARLRDLSVPCEVCGLSPAMKALSRSRRPSPRQCLVLPLLLVATILKLRKLISRMSPDVIISNGIKCHVLSPLAAAGTGARLIWHVRDVLRPGLLRWWLALTAGLCCALVITNSRAVARTLPARRTVTLHNGIDLGVFHPGRTPLDRRADLHLPPGACVIGAVGHLAPVKGFETLLAAAPMVLAERPDAHFVIAGGAIYEAHRRYERRLRDIIRDRGLGGRVHLLGAVDDVPALLAALDVFVLPSHSEGFGRAVAEALAVGRPVVASAVGGVGEIVRDGVDGLLVPPGDCRALAAGILRLTSDPALRARLADAGGRRVRRRFSLARHASRVESAIRSALAA